MSTLHPISGCKNENRKADVIFVHGLGGDAFATWRADENSSFPHWIGEAEPNVGVWSLGYAASPTWWARFLRWISLGRYGDRDSGYALALPRRAGQVLDLLKLKGFGERPIFFICHSLGGLVVKQVLRAALESPDPRHQKIATQIRAVLFLATPHSGAFGASILHFFRKVSLSTVSVEDLRAHDAHLGALYDVYRNHSPRLGIATRTYYEQRPTYGLLPVVNATSAHPGVGDDPVALDEDHLSIAKPRDREALVYLAAIDLIRRHVLADGPPHEKPPPSADPIRPVVAPVLPEIVVRVDTGAPKTHPIPRQLPPAAAKQFFGRAAELDSLEARLRAGKHTAVVGPGGLGKTALAAEALRRVVGDHGDDLAASPFRDGVVFLDLYQWKGNAEVAWNTLASSLAGGEFLPGSSARERATEACRGRRILVIVEGGEVADGRDDRATVEDFFAVLSRENCRLLLTREPCQTMPSESVELREALEPADAEKLLDLLCASGLTELTGPLRERVLALLEGHPLAITWAGNLLARGDAPARQLVEEWEQKPLHRLSDPKKAEHTLEWLFKRSVSGLDEASKTVLEAAGLLAHASFPEDWIAAVVSPEEARAGLRVLVQRGFLRIFEPEERWQFGHVLAYRFARVENGSDPLLRERLAASLLQALDQALATGGNLTPVPTLIDHAAALLRTDDDQRLWPVLAKSLLSGSWHRLVERGQLPLAQRDLIAFRGWLERLPEETVRQDSWERQRAALLDREGYLRQVQGNLAEALCAFRESLEITRRLAMEDSSNANAQRDLSVSLEKVGDVLKEQGNLAEALRAFRESLEIAQRLAMEDSSNASAQSDLSISLDMVGEVLKEQGNLAGALRAFRESLEIRQRLTKNDPSNASAQRDLSISLDRVGDVLKEHGNLAEALRAFRESLEITQRLAMDDPSNANAQRDLSIGLEKVGNVLKEQGNLAEALSAFRESLEIAQQLAKADRSNANAQRDLSVGLEKVGDVLKEQGNLAGALSAFRESLEIRQRLAMEDGSNANAQRGLGVSLVRVGDVLEEQGNLAEALRAFSDSLEMAQQLAEADRSNTSWQRDLSFSLFRLATLHEHLGKPTKALQLAKECLAISEKLAALDHTKVGWQNDLKASRELVERLRRG